MTQFHPFDCICVDIWGSGVRRDDFLADVFRTVFVCVMEMELGMRNGIRIKRYSHGASHFLPRDNCNRNRNHDCDADADHRIDHRYTRMILPS